MDEIVVGIGFDATKVAPKLYLGAYPGDGPGLLIRAKAAGFDRVVRCDRDQPHEFDVGNDVIPLSPAQAKLFEIASDDVAAGLRQGRRTLVTCAAGINRSALVAGLAMVKAYGIAGPMAYVAIRSRRRNATHVALCNGAFAAYLVGYTRK